MGATYLPSDWTSEAEILQMGGRWGQHRTFQSVFYICSMNKIDKVVNIKKAKSRIVICENDIIIIIIITLSMYNTI